MFGWSLFLSTLNWFGLICLSAGLLFFVALVIILLRSDCDLSLKLYEKYGANPSKALYGKVVWITGASSGIGEDLCYTLASCGAKLILSSRTEKQLRKVLEKCKGEGSMITHCDRLISVFLVWEHMLTFR